MRDILGLLQGADDSLADQIAHNKYRLAMSAGKNHHDHMPEVMERHFVQSGKAAGFGQEAMRDTISDLLDRAEDAPFRQNRLKTAPRPVNPDPFPKTASARGLDLKSNQYRA